MICLLIELSSEPACIGLGLSNNLCLSKSELVACIQTVYGCEVEHVVVAYHRFVSCHACLRFQGDGVFGFHLGSSKTRVDMIKVRLLTHVLCKPTHFFFHSFIATVSYSLQTSFSSLMKYWADKYHVWGTPTRSPSRSNSR